MRRPKLLLSRKSRCRCKLLAGIKVHHAEAKAKQ